MSYHDVPIVFETRDRAVKEKNAELFLSTQLGEIAGAGSSGYLSTETMRSEVLAQATQDDLGITCVAFVRERYFQSDKETHHEFLVYYLVYTAEGWKIYQIVA